MTDATHFGGPWVRPREEPRQESLRLPAPDPLGAPVFIHDCVTPLGGETLLSLLMKRMEGRDQP
jgi:hypothetical protein